ncbi:MAG: hypothetical protein U9Q16_01770 [Patescibacteria group bacterium]|nr:hypothetical protein [Patescibacteria group bacterium]
MSELSEPTQKLIKEYQIWQQSIEPKQGIVTIHADEVASRVAAFYERIRGIIDWKEEHLLKRRAIERILKRRLFSQMDITNGNFSQISIANPLILELIRGGHFPNDKIAETKINDVQKIIEKYVFILNNKKKSQNKNKIQIYSWLSSIAACEIEAAINPPIKEMALMNYMFELMKEKIRLSEETLKSKKINEKQKDIQIYIAVHQALFRLDCPIISYHLLIYKYPEWRNPSNDNLNEISNNIFLIHDDIEKSLNNPLLDKFYQICEKYNTPYLLLGDILSEDPSTVKEKISGPETLENLTIKAYKKRLKTLKSRLGRAAFYATLSIFLTNIISLLLIEIPFNKYVTGYYFNVFAIVVDILVPTFLMFVLVYTIKPPKKGNLEATVMEVIKIAYKREKNDVYEIKSFPKRNFAFTVIMRFLYLISFSIIIGIISWCLYQINFPPLSYLIFIIFFSLIAFAGVKIRKRSKELEVIERKETFFPFVVDLFAVPIIQLGNWLTGRWKKYNVITMFFTALVDMPFLVFVEFIEQWRYFLKEKKEKIH